MVGLLINLESNTINEKSEYWGIRVIDGIAYTFCLLETEYIKKYKRYFWKTSAK